MARTRLTKTLIVAVLAVMTLALCRPCSVASAQDRDALRSLFPAELAGLEQTEYHDEDWMMTHMGRVIMGALPVHRVSASYSDGADTYFIVNFVMADPALARLFPRSHHGALELSSLDVGDLREAEVDGMTMYEGTVVSDWGGEADESLHLVVSLGGHAAIAVESRLPGGMTLERMREAVGQLDLAAFGAVAGDYTDGNEHLWNSLSLLPAEVMGKARTVIYIESDGRRRGRELVVMGGYGGDPRDPAIIFSVAAIREGVHTIDEIRESFGIGRDDEPDREVQGRPLFHLKDPGVDAAVTLFGESGVLGLMATAEATPDMLADALSAIDADPFFAVTRAFSLTGYEEPETVPGDYEAGEPRLVSWAHVMDEEMREYLDEVDEEYLIFRKGHPVLDGVGLMDILVAPDFLRRVVVIEDLGERLRFRTVMAGLNEIMMP